MLQVYADEESLGQAAAALFCRQAGQAVQARGRFSVALSGGRTPRRTYELLAQAPYLDQVAWLQVHVFWGDERCVPLTDPRSNARLARQAWLDHVSIPEAQIHPISCDQSPTAAAQRYEELLRSFFAGRPPHFDLIFLGLGEDGHTASLFPGSPLLTAGERWVGAVALPEADLPRLTLTPACINQAALVVFLVAGAAKARILKEVLQGPRAPRRLPAQLIHPQGGQLRWLVDKEAASQLTG